MASFIEFQVEGDPQPYMICFFSTLNYRLTDSSILPIEQEAGWCEECRCFGSMEVVPSLEELRGRLQELQIPSVKRDFIHSTQDSLDIAINDIRRRLKWRQTRESPARCLVCGSAEIKPLRFTEGGAGVVNGKQVLAVSHGFADTADWVAEYSSEGIAIGRTPID